MEIALNGATTMHADLETDIRATGAAGFELIEIWAAKLRRYLESNTTEDLRTLLSENGIRPYSINSIEHVTFRNEADYAAIRAECRELCSIASAVGCPYVVIVPGKMPEGASETEIVDGSVEVLRDLGAIASEFEVGLAFEFLGQTDCSVQTLDLCSRIVSAADRVNIGLVIDTFHFYAGASSFDAIARLEPAKLFIFHINDAEDLPKHELTDAHRLYPGEGILPVREIRDALLKIGYDRMASVEIFRPEYWEEDPFEVAKRARIAALNALGLGNAASG